MIMESIQNATAAYQGSGSAAEKTQKAPKTRIQLGSGEETAVRAAVKDADKQTADKITIRETVSDSSLKKAVEEIRRKSFNTEAVFGYHEGTNRVTIKIMDKDTKEVKKEYPAEETLDMIQKVWEMAGLMVDEKW